MQVNLEDTIRLAVPTAHVAAGLTTRARHATATSAVRQRLCHCRPYIYWQLEHAAAALILLLMLMLPPMLLPMLLSLAEKWWNDAFSSEAFTAAGGHH
jgi:hypothetical protein